MLSQKKLSKVQLYQQGPEDSAYDFYRCSKCLRIVTREQEIRRRPTGKICPCGSAKYYASNPVSYEWLKWSVIRVVFKFILARVIAPRFGAESVERFL